jgi:hypothetical protein
MPDGIGLQWKKYQAEYKLRRNWNFTSRCASANPLWFTPWNKSNRTQGPRDWRDGLFGGVDRFEWMEAQRDWFHIGRWNSQREAYPVWLTPKGLLALKKRPAIKRAGGLR